MAGPSYTSRQDSNRLPQSSSLSDQDDSGAYSNLSSSQARRSRAARFGTSRYTTYSSNLSAAAEDVEEEQLALSYAAPTGTSTSSIYLPEYVAWAISQLITAANDPKLLRADHLKLAHLTDPQEHMAEAAHIPPKRSSLLHLATVSPHRYAAILAVLAEVRQRLSSESLGELEAALPRWTPDTVLDFDCAAGEGLWAAAQVFREGDRADSETTLRHYHGYDRRPNLLKSGKRVAQSSASNVSPADPVQPEREVRLKEEGEEIKVDGVTYYEQEESPEDVAQEQEQAQQYFAGPISAMASVNKTFQSVPLARDLLTIGTGSGRSLALSAFALSLMTNDSSRFEAVQAMWDSGAEVIVVIDSATPRGFASVASARAQLLSLGEAHVVAPCAHDKPCPLLHPFAISSAVANAVGVRGDTGNGAKSKQVCGFTARYHAPGFLRRTKHSDKGEENVRYSYVVVKRGPRPSLQEEAKRRLQEGRKESEEIVNELTGEAAKTKTGILDLIRAAKKKSTDRRTLEEVDTNAAIASPEVDAEVGGEDMTDEQAMDQLVALLPDAIRAELADGEQQLTSEQLSAILSSISASSSSTTSASTTDTGYTEEDDGTITLASHTPLSELAMRLESYTWPRLIKSPLKKGGHVTLDACCSSGNIERFTISRASGKQAYQDARKSKWGDLFPHPSRSKSVIKALNPLTALEYAGEEGNLEEKLVLRAPSKLKGKQVIGLDGEDADAILAELFEDEGNLTLSPSKQATASYKLISPNLITPTRKQEKRLSINYANKWDPTKINPATTNRLTNIRTNLRTKQTLPDQPTGFTSTLQSAQQSPEFKIRRSSRKKSRGDWDEELFRR